MKILSLGDMKSGCWQARQHIPLREMGNNGHTILFTDGTVDVPIHGYDILVMNNFAGFDDGIESFKKGLNESKMKLVWDCDDALDKVPDYARNDEEMASVFHSFDFFLKHADLITTTTPYLKEYLQQKTKKPIAVLPNMLDPKAFPLRRKHNFRVGFAGSESHVYDLLSVIDEMIDLKKKYTFDFYVLGFSQHPWNEYLKKVKGKKIEKPLKKLTKKLKELDFIHIPAVPTARYAEKLHQLGFDVGICPLLENDFTKCKSAIKFYEYSLVGTCAVSSDVLPYSPEPVAKWNDLERIIADEAFREKERIRMREWVLAERNIKTGWKLWEKAYTNL